MNRASGQPAIRVLLVDDHPTVLWGLEKLVDSARPRMAIIGKAGDGATGLAAAEALQPDVVLLDVDLGEGQNGLDLISEFRRLSSAKVLIVTGLRDSELAERAVVLGASGMVHKAASGDVILNAIERVALGELWLDRATTAKVVAALSSGTKSSRDEEGAAIATLTDKEREIIAAVVEHKGAPLKVIADTLCLSFHTVRNHLASIYSKLSVRNRFDLFMYAKERGLDKRSAIAEQARNAGRAA